MAARLSRAKKGAIVLVKTFTLLCLLSIVLWSSARDPGVKAQDTPGAILEVQVAVQPLSDGKIEFAVLYQDERILPDGRFLTPELIESRTEVWLRSTPVVILGPEENAPALLGSSAS